VKAIMILFLGFGIGLAILAAQRMTTDAMGVIIGVAVGIAASIPTSLLLVALLRRKSRREQTPNSQLTRPELWPPAPPTEEVQR